MVDLDLQNSRIRLLPTKVINMIAAGEVVERPYCVLKELVENSIDAGATNIKVAIKRGGRNLIEVIDDGCGMNKEELKMAFVAHATSKMNDYDLTSICSLGFRGEALAAVASVSKVEASSKIDDASIGWKLSLVAGEISNLFPDSISKGTKISVYDLFFATPNKIRFLSSERTETQHMINIINRMAIAYPGISFELSINDKLIFHYSIQIDNKALAHRIEDVKSNGGMKFLGEVFEFQLNIGYVSVMGYGSLPTFHRMNTELMLIYVNGRSVRNSTVNAAIRRAYSDFIPNGCYPAVVIFIALPPDRVDVNIHPNKLEVQFADNKLVHHVVFKALEELIAKFGNMVCQEKHQAFKDKLAEINMVKPSELLGDNLAVQRKLNGDLSKDACLQKKNPSWLGEDDFSRINIVKPSELSGDNLAIQGTLGRALSEKSASCLGEDEPQPILSFKDSIGIYSNKDLLSYDKKLMVEIEGNIQYIGNDHSNFLIGAEKTSSYIDLGHARFQFEKTYIISESNDCLFIIDQHAAHERLVYEQFKCEKAIEKQYLLVPYKVYFDDAIIESLEMNSAQLSQLGLGIECNYQESCVTVNAIPAILGSADIEKLLAAIADSILEYGVDLFLSKNINMIYSAMACHTSIRAGKVLKLSEMEMLLKQMEASKFSAQCNHGRPTYLKIGVGELAKLFDRS